ncbi:hypothetical protein ESCO_005363 [Escovopsis weberi]|uniref:Uncharacterized protein n=1 Tax=Escovopsis weberi TaxID=150374 RepID=A0A0M9VV16_ESCWE|nr:hypothetical protein ESCO_005363 [Escovopsis weberi]
MAQREQTPDPLQLREGGTLPSVPGTERTRPWACTLFDPAFGIFSEEDLKALGGANCSVLDGGGRPPTLWSIIQHIRQLIRLVRQLFGSDGFQLVDGDVQRGRRLRLYADELWELITNPDEPAAAADEMYHVPLWGLLNTVKAADEEKGIEYHCPLTTCRDTDGNADGKGKGKGKGKGNEDDDADAPLRRPYRSHHNLVMHANECLEVLDHEYAATGGLLSLLPTEDAEDAAQLESARNTLLGQWLLFTQHLVARMHELELSYAGALDVLAGEAVVPHQMLARLGAGGRAGGRELVFPQDRFVLANADEDVAGRIHRLLDRAEARHADAERQFWESGVSGERMWARGGQPPGQQGKSQQNGQGQGHRQGQPAHPRGLVGVDLTTRFCRLADQGRDAPIFVLPAIEHHPGIQRTRELEQRPTVVSVVTPRWTERLSDLEERLRAPLRRAREAEDANAALRREVLELRERLGLAVAQLDKTRMEVRYYEAGAGEGARGEVLAALGAYRDKMERLKAVLPEKYHKELAM